MKTLLVIPLLFGLTSTATTRLAAQNVARVPAGLLPSAASQVAVIPIPVMPSGTATLSVRQSAIDFPEKLPELPGELPAFMLQPPSRDELRHIVDSLLAMGAAGKNTGPLERTLDSAIEVARDLETGAVRAWMDPDTGSLEIYPALAADTPALRLDAASLTKEFVPTFFGDLFPGGAGRLVVGATRELRHARAYRDDPNASVTAQLLYVSMQRRIGSDPLDQGPAGPYRVEGPAARATVAIDDLGRVHGLALSHRLPTQEVVSVVRSKMDLRDEIAKRLEPHTEHAHIRVRTLELVYYDAGAKWLQPAVRFIAELTPEPQPTEPQSQRGSPLSATHYLLGYVPFGETPEPIESHVDISAIAPQPAPAKSGTDEQRREPIGVGRYVTRGGQEGFTRDANEFWAALAGSSTALPIYDAEYFYAEPQLFTQPERHVHGVQLALVEAHGFPGGFATNGHTDLVEIANMSAAGGANASVAGTGRLWAFHSCEVVATPDDVENWAAPWWSVASSVTNVVGYRTPMYINDGAGLAYGTSLGLGAPVRSAWLNDVASLTAYGDNPYGCKLHELIPFGKPAVIAACDSPDRGLEQFQEIRELEEPKCLDAFWLGDTLNGPDVVSLPDFPKDALMCEPGLERLTVLTEYVESCIDYNCSSGVGACFSVCAQDQCVQVMCPT